MGFFFSLNLQRSECLAAGKFTELGLRVRLDLANAFLVDPQLLADLASWASTVVLPIQAEPAQQVSGQAEISFATLDFRIVM